MPLTLSLSGLFFFSVIRSQHRGVRRRTTGPIRRRTTAPGNERVSIRFRLRPARNDDDGPQRCTRVSKRVMSRDGSLEPFGRRHPFRFHSGFQDRSFALDLTIAAVLPAVYKWSCARKNIKIVRQEFESCSTTCRRVQSPALDLQSIAPGTQNDISVLTRN